MPDGRRDRLARRRPAGEDRAKDVTRTITRLVDEMLGDLVHFDAVCDTS